MTGENEPKKFYLNFEKNPDDGSINQGGIKTCTMSFTLPDPSAEPMLEEVPRETKVQSTEQKDDFATVLRNFEKAMDGYRNFVPLTLTVVPHIAYVLGFQNLRQLSEEKGTKREDCSNEKNTIYEIDIEHFNEFSNLNSRMATSVERAKHLPEVMLIGLISTYDAMLGRLLKVVLNEHEEIVLTSEKTLKFSELASFGSIELARAALIEREIDSALRESHHKQFSWMESKFSLKLREGLTIWPTFIEVCERRNLITHSDGHVSSQYISSAAENKFDVSGVVLGQKLRVEPKYYANAVNAVYEVGAKLCHVLWRKFAEKQREDADAALNRLGYALVVERNYELAETMLRFGTYVLKKHHNDEIRRMMIVNLANAIRLQGRQEEANAVLQKEDWSAVGRNFKICVAAVHGNVDEVVRLMKDMGAGGALSAEDYRSWPVFRGMRSSEKFTASFEDVFKSKLFTPKKVNVETLSEVPEEVATSDTGNSKMMH